MNNIIVNEGVPMDTKRPAVVTIAAILLIVLSRGTISGMRQHERAPTRNKNRFAG